MNKKFVLASANQGKLEELQQLLLPQGFTLKSLSEFTNESVAETATTFIENALIKARYAAKISGLPAIADDSGLCVDALGGAPGLISARYAGMNASSDENIHKLLAAMKNFHGKERRAKFVCVIVALKSCDDPLPIISLGEWYGEIALEVRGDGGFGYDPIFYLPTLQRMASELPASEKNKLSHRGQALSSFLAQFASGFCW